MVIDMERWIWLGEQWIEEGDSLRLEKNRAVDLSASVYLLAFLLLR